MAQQEPEESVTHCRDEPTRIDGDGISLKRFFCTDALGRGRYAPARRPRGLGTLDTIPLRAHIRP